MNEFSMVFRDPTDRGAERTKATPAPAVLVAQLNSFIMKWKEVEYSGRSVLSQAALKEADNLRKHMEKGCLSGIKPGRGTNRNEALHKISIELSQAQGMVLNWLMLFCPLSSNTMKES